LAICAEVLQVRAIEDREPIAVDEKTSERQSQRVRQTMAYIELIELPAKLLDYFLRLDKSIIKQSRTPTARERVACLF